MKIFREGDISLAVILHGREKALLGQQQMHHLVSVGILIGVRGGQGGGGWLTSCSHRCGAIDERGAVTLPCKALLACCSDCCKNTCSSCCFVGEELGIVAMLMSSSW